MKKAYITEESLPAKAAEWKARLAPFDHHHMEPRWKDTALLVIDMQLYFLDPESPALTPGGPPIIPNVRRLIKAFRTNHLPVIFSRHVHSSLEQDGGIMAQWWKGLPMESSPGSEIHPKVAPEPGEKIIIKHRYSAFYNTDLETTLRCLGVKDLILTGVMTNLCCDSTARDAFFRDYRVFFLLDATGAINEEFHFSTLINLAYGFARIMSTEEILDGLSSISLG
jgi:ureidoacrylate peracid hydrolase